MRHIRQCVKKQSTLLILQAIRLASDLLLVNFQRVTVVHLQLDCNVSTESSACAGKGEGRVGAKLLRWGGTYSIGSIFRPDTSAIKQETDGRHLLSLAFTESVHQFLELGRSLYLEEDFIVVVGNFDIQVIRGCGASFLGRLSLLVGHGRSEEISAGLDASMKMTLSILWSQKN